MVCGKCTVKNALSGDGGGATGIRAQTRADASPAWRHSARESMRTYNTSAYRMPACPIRQRAPGIRG